MDLDEHYALKFNELPEETKDYDLREWRFEKVERETGLKRGSLKETLLIRKESVRDVGDLSDEGPLE
jgi:hypothetical protein